MEAGKQFINKLQMCVRAVSLGTVDTLISHPASMTHYSVPREGDIQLVGIEDVASAYTPVPGGVGPMTITTLIRQTVEAAEKALG